MSVQAITWVLELSRSSANDRCVIFAIANHCDSKGMNGWPSLETIAHQANCSVATVKRTLSRLRRMGELDWKSGGGFEGSRRRSNYYWMPQMRADLGLPLTPETVAQSEPSKSAGADKGSNRATRAHLRAFNGSLSRRQGLTGEPRPVLTRPEPSIEEAVARDQNLNDPEIRSWLGVLMGSFARAEIKRALDPNRAQSDFDAEAS